MSHQYVALNDTVYFGFAANLVTGAGGDGSTPLFDVRLAGASASAAPVLSGTPTILTDSGYLDGSYEVAIAATTGNGFAAGNTYLVFTTLTISGVNPGACIGSFRTAPVPSNPVQWLGGTIPAVNVTGVPKVDVVDWLGSAPDALSSGKVAADLKLWLAAAPAALTASGYVQSMLLRWLTDNAGGTPGALTSTGYVKADAEEWKGGTIPAVNVTGVPKVDLVDWLGAAPNALSSGNIPADLKLWLAIAPLALSSQLVQAIVADYASGEAPLQPTVAGRTLDVTAGGAAALDWSNIESPTTVVDLSGTTIKDAADVPTANENADALLKRDWTAVTGEAARSVLNALRFLRNKWSVSGTTLTVTKEDDTTSAWTGTVTVNASADPITGNDPS